MNRHAIVCGLALLAAAPASAQTPERNGNIWDGLAHQPTRFDTRTREGQAGILPPDPQRAKQAQEVTSLCRKLLGPAGGGSCSER